MKREPVAEKVRCGQQPPRALLSLSSLGSHPCPSSLSTVQVRKLLLGCTGSRWESYVLGGGRDAH